MSKVTVQHAVAELRNQVRVGGPLPRTAHRTVHVLVFSYEMCCSPAASTVAVVRIKCFSTKYWSAGLANRTCATHHLSRNTEEGTVSFTRRTHSRNNARTSATRTLCAQHKCHLQGSSQCTTAFVADLVTLEVKVLQRRICLVKNARACHGAARSTSLKDVDHHVSPTTPDAKLIELPHSVPCPARRGHRRFKKEIRVVLSRVNLCHTPVSRYGISYHVVSFTGLWNVFSPSQHITKDIRRLASRS